MKQNFLRRLGALALAFALTLSLAPTAWAAPGDRLEVKTDPDGVFAQGQPFSLVVTKPVNGQQEPVLSSDYDVTFDKTGVIEAISGGRYRALAENGTVHITVTLKDGTLTGSCTVVVGDGGQTTGRVGMTVQCIEGPLNNNGDGVLLAVNTEKTATLRANVTGGIGVDDLLVTWRSENSSIASCEVKEGTNHREAIIKAGSTTGTTNIVVTLKSDGNGGLLVQDIVVRYTIYVSKLTIEIEREDTGASVIGTTVTLPSSGLTFYAAENDGQQSPPAKRDWWNDSPKGIVNITAGDDGRATIKAIEGQSGVVTITVTSSYGATAKFNVSVPRAGDVAVTGVTLSPREKQLGLNETFELRATVSPSNATNKEIEWKIEGDSRVVSITPVDGQTNTVRVRATAEGTVTIQAISKADDNKKDECKVTVTPGLTGIVIQGKTGDRLTLNSSMNKPGQTQALEARIQPSNANHGTVTWTSDNTSAVTVRPDSRYPNGLFAILTSVGPGEAKITVKCGDVEDSATVTIPGLVLSGGVLTMTNGKLSMKEGETDTLTYKAYGEAATLTNAVPNWISSDSSVVDVDRTTGAITARKSGTATITLELSSGNTYYEAKCEVTVAEDTSAIINAGTVNAGAAYKFDRLISQLQSVCSNKVGGTLSYINNLSVADTEQGILHDEHHSSDDTGAGVGVQDRYYRSANTSQGQRPLSDLSFVPRTTFSGTAEVSFTGWNTTGQPFNGLIRFTVNGTGDVMYASNEGEPVSFLASDFNFYHPNLKSVSFTPPQESVGTLYYNYTSAGQPGTKVTSGTQYKRTGTPGIDKITFVPASGYQGTVRIAYKGTDTSDRSFTGTVTITVTRASGTNRDPADISYSVRENSWVTFRPSDFGNASRYTLGETLSYVRFTPPPSSEGTLFYNYRGFSDFDSMVNNTTSYYYSGNPALGGVSFVPTTTTPGQVDIGYTGYTSLGNTFEGTIHITVGDATEGGQQQLPLHYTVFTGRTVNLSASDFNTACRNATGYDLASVQFTRLPGVSQGTLRYTRGGSSTANNVTTGIRFYRTGTGSSANLIGNVYFQAGNNTGTVTIPFTGTDERGTTFTDEVTIVVTPPTASEIAYSGTTASPIRLSSSRISSALSGAWSQTLSYITFTSLPSTTAGHLYVGYSGVGTGTQVNTGTRYYASGYPGIDQISFVPRGRYNGQVSVGYTAVSTSGQSVSGRILFSISSTGPSSYFSDMAYHTWAAPSVDYLYQNQVTNGVTATQYGPNQRINRCDFVLMLCRAFKFSGSNGYSFADVPTSSYFSQAVATAKQLGIVSGDGNNFRPYGQVTRQDAMVMTYNALQAAGWNVGNASTSVLNQFSDGASVSGYARTAVSALVQMGAVNGDNGRLLPHNSITRAEAAVILHFVMTM